MSSLWITAEEVYSLHAASIAEYGGLAGRLLDDCVEGKIGNAELAVRLSGQAGEKNQALAMAGYLLFYLVQGHCFRDGNKRAAWASAVEILRRIHYTVEAGDEEVIEFMNQVAQGAIRDGADVLVWLAQHLKFGSFDD